MTQSRGEQPMQVVTTLEQLRAARAQLRGTVGLVPTMGALHAGHLDLVRRAGADNDAAAVSIFVNPTQFNNPDDLARYPRTLEADLAQLAAAGVALVFTPTPEGMYPAGFQTSVEVGAVAAGLEGAHRPGHFRGVATVVAKLFNLMGPTTAYFGQKDAQQVAVVRQMTCDLNLPVRVVAVPTVREPDGLAMSSRNVRLTAPERAAAPALYRALRTAANAYAGGERNPRAFEFAVKTTLAPEHLIRLEYVSVNDARTLAPVHTATDAPLLLSLAAQVGAVRLIDNLLLPLALNSDVGLATVLGAIC